MLILNQIAQWGLQCVGLVSSIRAIILTVREPTIILAIAADAHENLMQAAKVFSIPEWTLSSRMIAGNKENNHIYIATDGAGILNQTTAVSYGTTARPSSGRSIDDVFDTSEDYGDYLITSFRSPKSSSNQYTRFNNEESDDSEGHYTSTFSAAQQDPPYTSTYGVIDTILYTTKSSYDFVTLWVNEPLENMRIMWAITPFRRMLVLIGCLELLIVLCILSMWIFDRSRLNAQWKSRAEESLLLMKIWTGHVRELMTLNIFLRRRQAYMLKQRAISQCIIFNLRRLNATYKSNWASLSNEVKSLSKAYAEKQRKLAETTAELEQSKAAFEETITLMMRYKTMWEEQKVLVEEEEKLTCDANKNLHGSIDDLKELMGKLKKDLKEVHDELAIDRTLLRSLQALANKVADSPLTQTPTPNAEDKASVKPNISDMTDPYNSSESPPQPAKRMKISTLAMMLKKEHNLSDTLAEIQMRLNNGCGLCGTKGHMASACPRLRT